MTFFLSFPEGTAFQNKVPGQFLIHSFPSISKAIVDKVQGRLCAALQKGKKIKNEATVTSERATFFPPFLPPLLFGISHFIMQWFGNSQEIRKERCPQELRGRPIRVLVCRGSEADGSQTRKN